MDEHGAGEYPLFYLFLLGVVIVGVIIVCKVPAPPYVAKAFLRKRGCWVWREGSKLNPWVWPTVASVVVLTVSAFRT